MDNLFEKGRISQSTHDSFNNEIAVAIAEIERQQQDLLQKMHAKTGELESQIKTLEMLLTNYEIQHVTGEIDENTYQLEINLLSNGLETAKNELSNIQDATSKLCAPLAPEPVAAPIASPTVEATPQPVAENVAVEATPAPAAENVEAETAPTEAAEMPIAPEPCIEEPVAVPEIAATPEIEAAPVMEQAPVTEEAPVMEQPVVEPVEETVEAAAPEEIPQETPVLVEEATVETATEDLAVEVAEPIVEAQEPVTEEIVLEQTTLEETEVLEIEEVHDELSSEMPSIVEEIVPENPCQAPAEAQTDDAAGAPEVCAETPQASMPSAKESLSIVETSDSDDKE